MNLSRAARWAIAFGLVLGLQRAIVFGAESASSGKASAPVVWSYRGTPPAVERPAWLRWLGKGVYELGRLTYDLLALPYVASSRAVPVHE